MLKVLFAALLATGCAGGTVAAGYGYNTYRPDLAYVGPGVHAVVGVGAPTYYSDNYYWRFNDGYWYRSRYYDRGWSAYQRPPRAIVSIDRPWSYYYRDGRQLRVDRQRFYRDRYRSDRGYRPRPRY
jgi:hypothetical protein